MLTKEDIERLAQATNALRPDWPVASLCTFLASDDRWKRPLREVALELVYVALDEHTKTPARIDQDGPWKRLHSRANPSPSSFIRPPAPDDCDICGKPPNVPHPDHTYAPRNSSGHGVPIPDPLRETLPIPKETHDG